MQSRSDHLRVRLARSLENYNPQGAHNALDEAFASLSTDAALSEVVMPCLQATVTRSVWTASAVAQVDFSTSLLESRLLAMASGWDNGGAPTAVIAHTDDEHHTLGGIIFGLALRDRGWRIAYRGATTPAASCADVAERTDARAVVIASRDPDALAALRATLQRLNPKRLLVLAGEGATTAVARQLGAELLPRHPVLAASELDRRLGAGARPRAPLLSARLRGDVHSQL
jgi:MerR family transcriptional regulator, light-induced transcriptional regulator